MKKILLIGGMGFIGHNLFFHLKKLGFDLKIIDSLKINNINSSNQKSEIQLKILQERFRLIKQFKIDNIEIDANDKDNLKKLIDEYKPDVIVHLGAVSHAKESNLNPNITFINNLNSVETTSGDNKKIKYTLHIFFI